MSLQDPNVLNPNARKRVAIVIANPTTSTTTGWPVGFWWSELTHPYLAFHEAGYEVEVFSPQGGACQADGNLITGQQNFSGAETARLVIEALGR